MPEVRMQNAEFADQQPGSESQSAFICVHQWFHSLRFVSFVVSRLPCRFLSLVTGF